MLTKSKLTKPKSHRKFTQLAFFHRALWFVFGGLCLFSTNANAASIYQSTEIFISSNFDQVPKTKSVWLTGELAKQIKIVLGHDYHKLRLRYWATDKRSAWVLEEIGKERYITAGFIVENNIIEKTSILVFRESRGWEIKFPFFTQQFEGLHLTDELELNDRIDNITGATLSVKAVQHMAKTALLLHFWVNK